jgi:hypothetical protein
MIISDVNRYVFVELPRSGSTAIANELCEHYRGESVLTKHSTYEDFLRIATPDQKSYFVFSCIRDPLDEAVSYYFKAKSDPDESFSRLASAPFLTRLVHGTRLRRHMFATDPSNDFSAYLKRFYKLPYSNWAILSHARFDYVIRFEALSPGFSAVLDRLGLDQVRPLPQLNPTAGRSSDYSSHYLPEIQDHAWFIFGPFMQEWGYELPDGWESGSVSLASRTSYRLVNIPRRIYWRYLRRLARRAAAPPARAGSV